MTVIDHRRRSLVQGGLRGAPLLLLAFFACAKRTEPPPPPPNVIEISEQGGPLDCAKEKCLRAYEGFAHRHRAYAHPISEAELAARLTRAVQVPLPPRAPLGPEALRIRVTRALNIDFLLKDMDSRPLTAIIFGETRHDGYTERTMAFDDPFVGRFEVLLLIPEKPKKAGVLALHGHADSGKEFADRYLGSALARAGYWVVLPSFRASNCDPTERRISRTLLRGGFTLMGLRVYEALLALKYLRSLPQVGRIAIVSHSGGSSVANLLVRLVPHVSAYTGDYTVDFRDDCLGMGTHCETVPDLVPLAAAINDFISLDMPRINAVPLPRSRENILAFLAAHL